MARWTIRSGALAAGAVVLAGFGCSAFSSDNDSVTGAVDGGTDTSVDTAISDAATAGDDAKPIVVDKDGGPINNVVLREGFETTVECETWDSAYVNASRVATSRTDIASCRICLNTPGDGALTKRIKSLGTGTYTLEAYVREDLNVGAAPLNYCEAKIQAFDGPNSRGAKISNSGFLPTPQWTLVKTTLVVTLPSTEIELRVMTNGVITGMPPCMFVDDIEVRFTPP